MTTSTSAAASALAEHSNAAVGTWSLDPAASLVEFEATSFWGLAKVRGRFRTVTGTAQVEPDGRATAVLEIDVTSVDTNLSKRDEHLRTSDFLNAERHPRLEIAVRESRLDGDQRLAATGDVRLLGRTQPVRVEGLMTLTVDGRGAEMDAAAEVDARAHGMGSGLLGMVGRKVLGRAHLVFHKDPANAAADIQADAKGGG